MFRNLTKLISKYYLLISEILFKPSKLENDNRIHPLRIRSEPFQAIITALSVHSEGGGENTLKP